ncbi:hypothetical protein DL93DRAFT_2230668 [Clavulina sp. PMI_390]|nr:hypothetical protein DL93DRAFT_2230668 [Clavulina sp. PMI_390]
MSSSFIVSKASLVWSRFTLSKVTIAYTIFAIIHTIIQISLQTDAFVLNNRADSFLNEILRVSGLPVTRGVALIEGDGELVSCGLHSCTPILSLNITSNASLTTREDVALSRRSPFPLAAMLLSSVFDATQAATTSTPRTTTTGITHYQYARNLRVGQAQFDPTSGNLSSVSITGFLGSETVDISAACVQVLAWPIQSLEASGMEDAVLLAFNGWAFGLALMAVYHHSMPHIMAAVMTHLLLPASIAFHIGATRGFRDEFLRITRDGACDGIDLLPDFSTELQKVQIAQLVLGIIALIVSLFLSWELIKQFGWQMFKRVGADRGVNRMYRLVLGLSVVLQLSVFFVLASIAMWVQQMTVGPISFIVDQKVGWQITFLTLAILLVPWAACGWFGVRRESRLLANLFLAGDLGLLLAWSAMFFSPTFLLLSKTWTFFVVMMVASVVLNCVTLILMVACRVHFGNNPKTLSSYLTPFEEGDVEKQNPSNQSANPMAEEKIDFPRGNVPTYESFANPTPRTIDPLRSSANLNGAPQFPAEHANIRSFPSGSAGSTYTGPWSDSTDSQPDVGLSRWSSESGSHRSESMRSMSTGSPSDSSDPRRISRWSSDTPSNPSASDHSARARPESELADSRSDVRLSRWSSDTPSKTSSLGSKRAWVIE